MGIGQVECLNRRKSMPTFIFLMKIGCGKNVITVLFRILGNCRGNFGFIYRDAVWKDETQSLASLVNLLTSWCAYNNYCKANGEASGRKLLDELVSK